MRSQSRNKWRSTVSKHIVDVLRLLEKNLECANPHLQAVSTCYDIIFCYSFKSYSSSVFCASWATFRGIILYSVYWTGQPCDTFLPFVMRNRAPGFFLEGATYQRYACCLAWRTPPLRILYNILETLLSQKH